MTADFDHDGLDDVVLLTFAAERYRLSFHAGTREGLLAPGVVFELPWKAGVAQARQGGYFGPPSSPIVAADFDGDGYVDLGLSVSAFDLDDAPAGSAVAWNDRGSQDGSWTLDPLEVRPFDGLGDPVDLDGMGGADALPRWGERRIYSWSADRTLTFPPSVITGEYSEAPCSSGLHGDFTGDGLVDVVAFNEGEVIPGDGDPICMPSLVAICVGDGAGGFVLGEILGGCGLLSDIVVAKRVPGATDTIVTFETSECGDWPAFQTPAHEAYPTYGYAAAGDLDGDGIDEILSCSYWGELEIL